MFVHSLSCPYFLSLIPFNICLQSSLFDPISYNDVLSLPRICQLIKLFIFANIIYLPYKHSFTFHDTKAKEKHIIIAAITVPLGIRFWIAIPSPFPFVNSNILFICHSVFAFMKAHPSRESYMIQLI